MVYHTGQFEQTMFLISEIHCKIIYTVWFKWVVHEFKSYICSLSSLVSELKGGA